MTCDTHFAVRSALMAVSRPTASFHSSFARYCAWGLLGLAGACLVACSSSPKPPDWQLDAKSAADRFQDAQLKGDTRAAQGEFALARRETAATGRPELVARVELLRCALQTASLNFDPCTGFEALRADAAPPELAYAAYLAGQQLTAEQRAVLPAAQQAVPEGEGAAAVLAAMADPLSQLVAAGVLLRREQATPAVVQLAVDTASHQGWRRPLLAWLGVQARQADAVGQTERAQALRRRMDLVAPAASGASGAAAPNALAPASAAVSTSAAAGTTPETRPAAVPSPAPGTTSRHLPAVPAPAARAKAATE